jgi:hypothetical protein
MKVSQVILGLLLILGIGILALQANAVAVQPPSPTIYANSGQVVPFLISLNTVAGKAYYATISISAQTGLTASANTTAYPSTGTSTSNVTVPVGITVSGNPGIYQLNVTVTEYNSSTTPQSVLTSYKYTTYVHIISPQTLPSLLFSSATTSQSKSVSITIPSGASGWYLKYQVQYPNSTVTSKIFSPQAFGIPSVNVTVTPSATSGTTNTTVTFNVTVKSNLKFGEVPVTVVVYEYLQGTNALYATQVLHFNVFIVPPVANAILVTGSKFSNFTVVGHARFGNISILRANAPALILSVVKGSNDVQILFNNTFTGIVSFQTNATPTSVYADGQKLTEGYYTLPTNMPVGTWTMVGNTVYLSADPSNVTVVYSNATSTSTTTSTTTTTSTSTTSTSTTPSSFLQQHKDLILLSIAFLFVIFLVAVATNRR